MNTESHQETSTSAIFVLRDGERVGPLSAEDVRAQLNSGEVTSADYGQIDGQEGWEPIVDALDSVEARQRILANSGKENLEWRDSTHSAENQSTVLPPVNDALPNPIIKLLKKIGSVLVVLGGLVFVLLCNVWMASAFWEWCKYFVYSSIWAKILPWLFDASGISLLSLILLLPSSCIQKTRSFSAAIIYFISYIFGATLWVWSLIFLSSLWGAWAVVLGVFIFGVGVVPLAILAVLFKGMWAALFGLFGLLILTFGARYAGGFIMENPDAFSLPSIRANRTKGMTAVAALNMAFGALFVFFGMLVLYCCIFTDTDAPAPISAWNLGVALLYVAFGCLGVASGFGILMLAPWGRKLAFIFIGMYVAMGICENVAYWNTLPLIGHIKYFVYPTIQLLLFQKKRWREAMGQPYDGNQSTETDKNPIMEVPDTFKNKETKQLEFEAASNEFEKEGERIAYMNYIAEQRGEQETRYAEPLEDFYEQLVLDVEQLSNEDFEPEVEWFYNRNTILLHWLLLGRVEDAFHQYTLAYMKLPSEANDEINKLMMEIYQINLDMLRNYYKGLRDALRIAEEDLSMLAKRLESLDSHLDELSTNESKVEKYKQFKGLLDEFQYALQATKEKCNGFRYEAEGANS